MITVDVLVLYYELSGIQQHILYSINWSYRSLFVDILDFIVYIQTVKSHGLFLFVGIVNSWKTANLFAIFIYNSKYTLIYILSHVIIVLGQEHKSKEALSKVHPNSMSN